MFGDDTHDGPPLHVSEEALRKPAGATVGADGLVACVSCGTRLSAASADIVGQGYRCPRCTHAAHVEALASGRSDAGSHLSELERTNLRNAARDLLMFGGAAVAGGIVLVIVSASAGGLGLKLGMFVIASGVGMLAFGASKRSAAG
ncbi:MAG: hypothetical protein H0T89_35400 [Deltaproteobacteria bacterium]|nr:hypothetical protein [Deltaproteobacteria bacterium]MDQ3298804.1 hypothetical protein [Myxococcota bacterium]